MKKGWETSCLGAVLAVIRNGLNCKQNKSGNGDRISRIESIADGTFDLDRVGYAELSVRDKEKYRLQRGDILFSHINSAVHVGKTAVFDCAEPVYHGVNLLLMRPNDAVIAAYLGYALKHLFQSGYWRRVCKKSVNQSSVNQRDISCVQICYPKSLDEQRRIVAILDEAFEGIAAAKANAEENLRNARAVCTRHLCEVFESQGDGRQSVPLLDVVKLKSGTTVAKQQEQSSGDIPYVKVADMNLEDNRNAIVTSTRFLARSTVKEATIFPVGTTIFPKRGGAIATNKKRFASLPMCADLNIMGAIPNPGVSPRYLFAYFRHLDLRKIANGTTVPQINNYSFAGLSISMPFSLREQDSVAVRVEAMSEQCDRISDTAKRKLAALDELKASLLHQAFTGQL